MSNSLALRGQRVLLVDLDPQGNLTSALGQDKSADSTVADALLDRKVPLPIVGVENGDALRGGGEIVLVAPRHEVVVLRGLKQGRHAIEPIRTRVRLRV